MNGLKNEDWRIRVALPGDQAAIEALAQAAYAIYLPRMDKKPFPLLEDYRLRIASGEVHVLEDSEGIQGYVVLLAQPDGSILLDNIATSPHCRGKGYGRALVEYSQKHASRLGADRIWLYTNEAMRENMTLYPHLGFTETHRALDHGYRRVFFEKRL